MPLRQLQRAHRNPKVHDTEGIRASIDRHGYVDPIVMDERTQRMVSGHGRLDDLLERQERGLPVPEGIEQAEDGSDWLAPVYRGWHSKDDADAEAYLVGANQLPGAGGWDPGGLAKMFADYRGDDSWFLGTGYRPEDALALLQSTGELTREATAYLGTPAGADDGDGPGPLEGLEGWVAVNFTVRTEQRQAILEALDRIRRQESLGTRAEALVELCRRA